MSNPFLTSGHEEIETAILLEKATHCDLGELNPEYANAVAFTDGKKVFINSEDRLAEILPAYNQGMLKWLLWHEEYHKQLCHHNRFFRYLDELKESDYMDEFQVTKDEVNIIMDILVHDSLCKMFPELIPTAIANLAQLRNQNSLGYTFKTNTLEDMLDEYRKHKHGEDEDDGASEDSKGEGTGDTKSDTPSESKEDKEASKDKDESKGKGKKGHTEGGSGESDSGEDEKSEMTDGKSPKSEPDESKHDETDWTKLEEINTKEFITEDESERIDTAVERIRRKKFKLAKLTQTLNGLATTTRARTYSVPSYVRAGEGTILKGRKPGKTDLYLVFDASGSMGRELETFKEIISKSIPHAMSVPCEWFSGCTYEVKPYKMDRGEGYYKATFKDMMRTYANSGYNDDGDRTIALCLAAEEKGFTPIGVTDGGGGIYEPDVLKKLKRTVLVGHCKEWLDDAKRINPHIQVIDI